MSDTPQTPEAVAFALMEKILGSEFPTSPSPDRAKILSTYRECIAAVRGENPPRI